MEIPSAHDTAPEDNRDNRSKEVSLAIQCLPENVFAIRPRVSNPYVKLDIWSL